MQLFGRRYDTSQPVRLEIAGEKIAEVAPVEAPREETQRWPWIAPGLIDLQVNGYGGPEFNSAELTGEDVAEVIRAMDRFGVTRFCPTLTTERFEVLQRAMRVIAAACDSSAQIARRVAGIHLEGPYVSTEDGARGAHPREYCRRPDWDEFQRLQEAAGGRIRLLTMAVEFDEAPAFIHRAAESGVVVAIGHTAADSHQIRAAVDAGARMSTHLGNGSHPMIHRHNNHIWDQLAEDRLVAGLIVDGCHLSPAVVKTFVRAKTPGRCILVSDTVGLAGSPPGRYSSTLCDVEVLESGKLVIAGQRELLAGASEPIGTGIANVVRFAGVSLAEAVRMAVDHPARLLGIEPGNLQPGDPADLVLFDLGDRFDVRATVVAGETVFFVQRGCVGATLDRGARGAC
ncbi:MAG TPA: amidohydrolase family protein [Thermoguttaceae bacterium]|nr:amidohydrolase family protein [Thermoguttaceae bacterium]